MTDASDKDLAPGKGAALTAAEVLAEPAGQGLARLLTKAFETYLTDLRPRWDRGQRTSYRLIRHKAFNGADGIYVAPGSLSTGGSLVQLAEPKSGTFRWQADSGPLSTPRYMRSTRCDQGS
jgi:hypothetical protein